MISFLSFMSFSLLLYLLSFFFIFPRSLLLPPFHSSFPPVFLSLLPRFSALCFTTFSLHILLHSVFLISPLFSFYLPISLIFSVSFVIDFAFVVFIWTIDFTLTEMLCQLNEKSSCLFLTIKDSIECLHYAIFFSLTIKNWIIFKSIFCFFFIVSLFFIFVKYRCLHMWRINRRSVLLSVRNIELNYRFAFPIDTLTSQFGVKAPSGHE